MVFKNRFLILLFISILNLNFAQKASYIDSLSKSIASLSKKKQVISIIGIPYDKAVGDINAFELLSDKAILFSKELNDSLMLANAIEQKVLALHFTSKNEEALQLSLVAIRIYENLGLQMKAGKVYSDLGWKLKHRDFDKAFSYMQKGIKIRVESNDVTNDLYGAYDNFGVLHGMKKQWDSALYYHKKSLIFRKSVHDSIGIPFGYAHVANVYLNTKKYNLAEKYIDSSLFIREKRKDIYGITDSKLYFGDLFFAKGDYEKAINNFQQAYELSDKQKYYPLKKYAAEYLYKSYDSIKDYKHALKFNLLYNKLKDSVSNVETNSRIAQLEIEFQTEKNEKEILSQRADLAENKLNLNRKNTQIIGLLVLAVVLGLLGHLFYNQQKIKNKQLQKENELKDALIKIETQNRLQEQRLRISRDLHDNIGAQLTFIISSLDNLKYGFKIPEKLSNKLKGISEFTTTTIYELRDTIWAMNKSEITFEDLQSRISNFIDKASNATHQATFNFNVDDNLSHQIKFTSIQGMNLYRIIQEGINNAIKYAEASTINVEINEENNDLQVVIIDNGIGFIEEDVVLGNGMINMNKRASELKAQLSVKSKPNDGTKIQLLMPLNT